VRELRFLTAVFCFSAAAAVGGQDFPEPPADSASAEASGLKRVTIDELKAAFVGAREERNPRGESHLAHYRADGGIELRSGSSLIDRGSFSITAQRGGSLCLMLDRQMNQRLCSIWFAAPDNVHLYGYNPGDGKFRAISRPAPR